MKQDNWGFSTRAIHAGQPPDPTTGAVVTPVYMTSTYAQEDVGKTKGYEYSRSDNPTRTALQECLAALEGGAHGLAFASGLAATSTLMYIFNPGDHIICGDDVYGGTFRQFKRVWERYGLESSFVTMTDLENIRRELRPNTTLIWIETPTNPLLEIVDIPGVVALARTVGARVVVDNTFASPYGQQPLALGADIALHSTTKYVGGHSDVVGGAIVTSDAEIYEQAKFHQNAVGGVPGPMDCFLTLRGAKTLAVRMRQHAQNAMAVARYLENQPDIERVIYPGLPSHPQHELAARQMRSFGGMVSVVMRDGAEAARSLAVHTRLFTLGESLGGVESLIEVPYEMTHMSLRLAGAKHRVPPGLVRLSVGIEDADDLIADLDQALAKVRAGVPVNVAGEKKPASC